MHVGCMGLAPKSHDSVDSIPPMPTGGNLDNKRIGVGTTMYYPVEVAGALLSMGDAHAAQGDGEIDGTAIETSITGTFKITLIKKTDADKPAWFPILDFPLGETADTFIVHGFTETDYLETYKDSPGDIYGAPGLPGGALQPAMMNAYTQTRKFMMATYNISQAESDTIMTQGVDFGITQLVDGNWGVHGVIPKVIFEEAGVDRRRMLAAAAAKPARKETRKLVPSERARSETPAVLCDGPSLPRHPYLHACPTAAGPAHAVPGRCATAPCPRPQTHPTSPPCSTISRWKERRPYRSTTTPSTGATSPSSSSPSSPSPPARR